MKYLLNPALRENWRGKKLPRYDTVTQPGLDAYRRNLESIVGMCQIHGVAVVIATVGHSLDGNADWNPAMGTANPLLYCHECQTLAGIRDGFRQYNRVNREVADQYDLPLVDLEKLLPEGPAVFQDDVHFTMAGSERVADLFLNEVQWDGWLGKKVGK
jgi:hypothetical protein